jgi:hypothetical protein
MEKKYLVQFTNNSKSNNKKKTNAFVRIARSLASMGDTINSIE